MKRNFSNVSSTFALSAKESYDYIQKTLNHISIQPTYRNRAEIFFKLESIFDSTRPLSDKKNPTLTSHVNIHHTSNKVATAIAMPDDFRECNIVLLMRRCAMSSNRMIIPPYRTAAVTTIMQKPSASSSCTESFHSGRLVVVLSSQSYSSLNTFTSMSPLA